MASRNGLNPKIRGQKGIGFNRALPAPFGFGKSFKAVGNADYFTVPKLVGELLPLSFTLEYWVKPVVADIAAYSGYFMWRDTSNNSMFIQIRPSYEQAFEFFTVATAVQSAAFNLNEWNHIVFTVDFINDRLKAIVNGNLALATGGGAGVYAQMPLSDVRVLHRGTNNSGKVVTDEFRIYNRVISDLEILTNYNNGIGNNASITEGIIAWYKFEQFENLDFSSLQDGSLIKLGIRDFSGKSNHALPNVSMITDLSSADYPLNNF